MADTTPTNDLAAREPIVELHAILGSKLVAYLAGTRSTNTIRRWTTGTTALPGHAVLARFQVALDAAHLITARNTPVATQAWFQGRNPALDDQPPIELLRMANLNRGCDTILAAAIEFATHSC